MGKEINGVVLNGEVSQSVYDSLKIMYDAKEMEERRIQTAKERGSYKCAFQILPHRNLGLYFVYDGGGNRKIIAEPLYADLPVNLWAMEYVRFTIDKDSLDAVKAHNETFKDITEEEIAKVAAERNEKKLKHFFDLVKAGSKPSIVTDLFANHKNVKISRKNTEEGFK